MAVIRKILFRFLEFLGLSAAFGLLSQLFNFFLSKVLGLKNLAHILPYWVLYGIAIAFLAYTMRKIKAGWTWKDLGFKVRRSWRKDIWYGLVVYGLLYIISIPLSVALLPSLAASMKNQMGSLFKMPLLLSILIAGCAFLIFGFITGAFHEEIWYRGYLQGLLSKEAAPALGFFCSFLFFSFGHYFSHPEWSLLAVLNTVPGGLAFCLAYHATGSLLVTMTVHTLANFVFPTFTVPFYANGYHGFSYFMIASLGVIFSVLCLIGKKEVRDFYFKTKELFVKSGWAMSLAGIILGIMALLFSWGKQFLRSHLSTAAYLITLGTISALTLGTSFLGRNNKK